MNFCRHLRKNNPNFLIPLLTPKVIWTSVEGKFLLRAADLFVDMEMAQKAFSGMAQSAFNNDKPNNIIKSHYLIQYLFNMKKQYPPTKKADNYAIKHLIDIILADN